MDLLIVLTYVALAWAVFKIFRIPVNQWTLATSGARWRVFGERFDSIDELQPSLYVYGAEGGGVYSHYPTGDGDRQRSNGQK